ncbi:hypothetical protein [Lentibacillus saliphilus]|uniref:hypothetical protein n=1 Tax=Lentibacillus saliphilus TaxID=2737028 RepID=UPI001C30DD1D|nr:hypothetical protein [Lentibacillus saliphilus]
MYGSFYDGYMPDQDSHHWLPHRYLMPELYQPHFSNPLHRTPYPEVDASLFHESAVAFKGLMSDASKLMNALATNDTLAYNIMDAAQRSDMETVKTLIQSTGVKKDVEVDFNPDGINMEMVSTISGVNCCKLNMVLRWR